MTSWTADQIANAATMAALVQAQPRKVQECVLTAGLVECSYSTSQMGKGDISATTGTQSTSLGWFQQTAAWAPQTDRLDLAASVKLFLEGGHDGQRGLLSFDYASNAYTVPDLCQMVQGSQYDGTTDWSKKGAAYGVLPWAQNYKDAYPAALEMLDLQKGYDRMMLTDLADVLRAAGLTVIEWSGWKDRTETDGSFNPIGILLHHDAMGLGENSNPGDDMNVPSYMSQNGVGGSQLWIRADGVCVTMAAGRKWHAGLGRGWGDIGQNSGNSRMLGIETDYSGSGPWPDALVSAIYRASAAIKQHYGFSVSNCCGHREYAPDRKVDPANFDLDVWRTRLDMNLDNRTPATPATPPRFPWPPPVTPAANTPPKVEDDMFTDADRKDLNQAKADIAALKAQLSGIGAGDSVLFTNYNGGIGIASLSTHTWRGVGSQAELATMSRLPRHPGMVKLTAEQVATIYGKQVK